MTQAVYKIALLGNFTTELIGHALQEECRKAGLEASVYHGPFQQYNQEIINPDSSFYTFQPDLTVLLLEGRILFPNWYEVPFFRQNDEKERESHAVTAADELSSLIHAIQSNSNTKILINNFMIPCHSPLGILDSMTPMGLKRMISLLNLTLERLAAESGNVYVFDYNGLCARIGHAACEDKKLSYLIRCPLSYSAVKQLSGEYMRFILPLNAMNKKCLVLDLDNTLWGGVAAEDGIGGISLDISGPGRSFYDFQQDILNLYHRGIILAVNSKNNPQDACEVLDNHPNMLLRKNFFSSIKINWQDKVTNLKEIAEELNIGLDSLVFFDDNPVEREHVKSMLPQVAVIEAPADPAYYCDKLRNVPYFEVLALTAEDMKRSEMMAQNRGRADARKLFGSLEEYLKSLETDVTVLVADDFNLPRISQLTLKTNQFNMTTKRYQTADIRKMLDSGEYAAYCCSVSDRFGNNGITGCCIVKLEGAEAFIDTFLLSCRVLGRNVEYAFLFSVVKRLREKGVGKITALFIPTGKNTVNADFYGKAGFRVAAAGENGTFFELDKGTMPKEIEYIKLKFAQDEVLEYTDDVRESKELN